jgi:RNA polymerase sigma-70 factor (ECF subfamily)
MQLAELPIAGEPLSSPSLAPSTRDPSTSENVVQQAMAIVQREVEPNTWQAFWLCVIEERSTEDVANSLAMKPANVRQCRSRVLRRLRQALEYM